MTAILSSGARRATPALVSAPTIPVVPAGRNLATPYVLFPAAEYGAFQERFIVNPNASGSIWVTFFDGITPAANDEGSFEIPPGGAWSGSPINEVRIVFTAAGMKITAGER